jgi:putative MATE family efflux protein
MTSLEKDSHHLITQPIPTLIRKIAMPASVGLFFYTMYNVVDTYFGGLVSTQALAALSLSMPVFFIIIALGSGLASGTTALIANALGAGNQEEARLYAVQGITFGNLTGIALSFIGSRSSPFLFSLLGASDAYLALATLYMNTLFLGAVFFMLVYMLNAVLNALGETRPFRNFLMVGFLLNVVLDPWFIYGGLGVPKLGFPGIAVATVLIQVGGAVYLGIKVHKSGLITGKDWKDILPKPAYFRDIAYQGVPASVNLLTVGVGIFVITYFVSGFGQDAVAAYGAAMRVEQIVLIPTIGLNVATLTIVAQNNGAGRMDRIMETLSNALKYGGIIMGTGTVGVFVLSRQFMMLFTEDPAVMDIGVVYLRIDALVFCAYLVLFVHIAALQGIKRPLFAIWIGLFRQIAAPYLVFILFTRVLCFGLVGIWWGILLVTWSAALFTWIYARKLLKDRMAPGA